MHWLVEVSRVGESVASERYCIEARRWQSALQEARRLRGDSGPLPNLTIELTDSGYRAIDPKLKVRYVVTEAPPGMPLTDGARAVLSTVPPPVVESGGVMGASVRPAPIAVSPPTASEPAPLGAPPAASQPVAGTPPALERSAPAAASGAPAAVAPVALQAAAAADAAIAQRLSSSVPPGQAPRLNSSSPPVTPLAAQLIRQREERPSDANPIAYREVAYAVKPGASRADIEALLLTKLAETRALLSEETRRYVQLAVFDHVFVKRPVRPPLATLQWKDWRGEPVLSFPGFGEFADAPPPSSISTQRMPSWAPGMMTSVAPVAGPSAVPPVATNAVPRPASQAPEADPPPAGFVPAARPVVQSTPPTLVSSAEEPHRPSVIPTRVVSIGPSTSSSRSSSPPATSRSPFATTQVMGTVPDPVAPAAASAPPAANVAVSAPPAAPVVSTTPPVAPAPEPIVAIAPPEPPPPSSGPDIPIVIEADEPPATPPTLPDTAALMAAEAARVAEAVSRNSAPPRDSAPPTPETRRSEPPAQRRSDPSVARRSEPGIARRRGPGEDLIGDLFERMHELSFMPDIVSGADFVASVLGELIPCEATLVHVFDLNRREFVVVRARGPHPNAALMFRTPDTDPFVIEVFRRPSMLSNGAAPKHSRAFAALGVNPIQVMARGARQGGRYLGLIELGNPQGGAPFHDGEVNALEYVCEQFADFVASRPVVLDEEVVRG